MVDNDGKVVNAPYRPYLIKSAGYPILNQQALKEVRASSFPNQTGKPQAYQITVDYKYNEKICPSLAVTQTESSRNESEKPLNTTKPSSETPSPPPVTPQNDAEFTEETKPNQPSSAAENAKPTSLREATETTAPKKPSSETVNSQPNSLREATELTVPKKPAPEAVSEPTSVREATETTAPKPPSEAVNSKPTVPKKAPEATEQTTPPKPKPNSENPAPASFRKPSETRPLGISAPKKPRRVESENSKTPSEALRGESEIENEQQK